MTARPFHGESRAYLQERVEVFARFMFWAFVGLRVSERILYRSYPEITPANYRAIVCIGLGGLAVLAIGWRLASTRRAISLGRLRALDLALVTVTTSVCGAIAMLAYDRHESAYTCLLYACFTVFVRTIVIPSSGRRTAAVAAIAFVPLWSAALQLGLTTTQDIPGPAFVAGAVMYGAVAVAIAIAGSRVIYGLRRRVKQDRELGQYRLERKLGEGPTGEVFLARHALLRRSTAIKLVHRARVSPEIFGRCERAVQQMSQLAHHNTAAVFDYGRSADGALYIAMEFLDGLDLRTLVDRHGPQPAHRVRQILIQLCSALHEAHRRGFAHGNIKPSNVVLCERGGQLDVAKLTDYGLSHASLEPTGADDLHALGGLARFLLTGSEAEAFIPSSLGPLVASCLDPDPARRPMSAKALATSLRELTVDDWNPASARAWWTQWRRQSLPVLDVPSAIAIDLAARSTDDAAL